MKIDFAHISPTAYLPSFTKTNGCHLVLAHLVESDEAYAEFYRSSSGFKIMDNSAFEMFKQGRPMFPADRLVDLADKCKADMVVLPDYPGEPYEKTIDAAKELAPIVGSAGYQTMFVPQSLPGDLNGYLESVLWAMEQVHHGDYIDRIGISILGAPNAFAVLDDPLQRFLSRHRLFSIFNKRGWFEYDGDAVFHILGMLDGPNEISLLKPFGQYIASWDSSAAIWAGLNDVSFDRSPTGLYGGKFELEVDFDYCQSLTPQQINLVVSNINYIDKLCRGIG